MYKSKFLRHHEEMFVGNQCKKMLILQLESIVVIFVLLTIRCCRAFMVD